WTLQVLATSGGHNPKGGIVGNDKYPSIFNANHGYYGAPNPLELWRSPFIAPEPIPLAASDEFNATALNLGTWRPEDPKGDANVGVDGSHALLSVPYASSHNLWSNGNYAVRLMQGMGNVDFQIEVKFDSVFTAGYQMQGLLVQQDSSDYLRFETHY